MKPTPRPTPAAVPRQATASDFDGLWRAVGQKPRAVLMLDYDGTLAPFQINRDEAAPYPGVRERLTAILSQNRTRVVIVSGRAAGVVADLLGISPTPEIWGSHGRERYRPESGLIDTPISPAVLAAIEAVVEWGREMGIAGAIETKPAGVAVHVRGLPSEQAQSVLTAARPLMAQLAKRVGMELFAFDGGIEMRDGAFTKAGAVAGVLDEMPASETVAVYLGDDFTDEDAFSELRARGDGVGILVRSQPRESFADFWIEPPVELLKFLDGWLIARQFATDEKSL